MDQHSVSPYATVLNHAHAAALDHLDTVNDRPVGVDCGEDNLRFLDDTLAGPLTGAGEDATVVIEDLARCARRGVVASGGGRFHGLVVGGTLPAAVAADWMVSAWDQCAAVFDTSPMTSIVEQAALNWTIELLGLGNAGPISGGFTQGTTEAHEVAFHAACSQLLAGRGWDAAADGMWGAPPFPVIVSADAHKSVWQALRYVGIGRNRVTTVPTDDQGRMRLDALDAVLDHADGPGLVVVSAGEINTGSFDPIGEIVTRTKPRGHWCHVDGAFGLWAGACPPLRRLTAGIDQADSWATDFHKMMQSTYDGGVVLCSRPEVHHAVMTTQAVYTRPGSRATGRTDGMDRVLGMARRARGVPVWAVLRSLGRDGVADLIWRCHTNAVLLAELVSAAPPGAGGQRRRLQPGAAGRRARPPQRGSRGSLRGGGCRSHQGAGQLLAGQHPMAGPVDAAAVDRQLADHTGARRGVGRGRRGGGAAGSRPLRNPPGSLSRRARRGRHRSPTHPVRPVTGERAAPRRVARSR